jgi:hypothetical protein
VNTSVACSALLNAVYPLSKATTAPSTEPLACSNSFCGSPRSIIRVPAYVRCAWTASSHRRSPGTRLGDAATDGLVPRGNLPRAALRRITGTG